MKVRYRLGPHYNTPTGCSFYGELVPQYSQFRAGVQMYRSIVAVRHTLFAVRLVAFIRFRHGGQVELIR